LIKTDAGAKVYTESEIKEYLQRKIWKSITIE
jgi:hypothetical protein